MLALRLFTRPARAEALYQAGWLPCSPRGLLALRLSTDQTYSKALYGTRLLLGSLLSSLATRVFTRPARSKALSDAGSEALHVARSLLDSLRGYKAPQGSVV